CHGWVFAMGQAWISGAAVDTILDDNGYASVDDPAVGDLVVYRDGTGKVLHSGIVRGVAGDERILVESKWGALGIYVHAAGHTGYADNFKFYRSKRQGHLLRGLSRPPSGSLSVQPG